MNKISKIEKFNKKLKLYNKIKIIKKYKDNKKKHKYNIYVKLVTKFLKK